MDPKVYKYFNMLKVLEEVAETFWDSGFMESASDLNIKNREICIKLKQHLSREDSEMLQYLSDDELTDIDIKHTSSSVINREYLGILRGHLKMNISILNSLDMNLNEELKVKINELNKIREELDIKTKEVDSMKKILDMMLSYKEGIPEIIRSTMQAEIKKLHREIEQNTNPNTKSQQKRESENIDTNSR